MIIPALFVFLILSIALTIHLLTGRDTVHQTSCTGCGYDLRGITTHAPACPECGRPMGRATTTKTPYDKVTLAMLLACLTLLALLIGATFIAASFFPD